MNEQEYEHFRRYMREIGITKDYISELIEDTVDCALEAIVEELVNNDDYTVDDLKAHSEEIISELRRHLDLVNFAEDECAW